MSDLEKEPFFNILKELEAIHQSCFNKVKLIENVLLGKEIVTFQVIDRCREAALQILQNDYVFTTQYANIANSQLLTENSERVSDLSNEVQKIVEFTKFGLDTILSWTPNAVNTRATGSQR
jgi:hypothetical protein